MLNCKLIVWKLVWKIIWKWEQVAMKNKLDEQVEDCEEMRDALIRYKNAMRKNGLWD